MYGKIYKITNLSNLKIYVGKTTKDIQERFIEHLKLSDKYYYNSINNIKQRKSLLYPAIHKYGKDSFIVEQIDTADSLDELNYKEKYWIHSLQSTNRKIGYNIAIGGDGGPLFQGHSQSDYCKSEASKRFKGKKQSDELVRKRMQSKIDKLPKIQCINTGEIYKNHIELDNLFNGDSRDALNKKHKFRGKYYIRLDDSHINGYSTEELAELYVQYVNYNNEIHNNSIKNRELTKFKNKLDINFDKLAEIQNAYENDKLGISLICKKFKISKSTLKYLIINNN